MVVVLPEPLTPITRMTCGRGKPHTSKRLGDRSEDLFDLLGEDGTKAALVEGLEFLAGNRLADALRRGGAEVGRDQRLLDIVEGGGVERLLVHKPGEILADLVRSLLEAGCQPVEPTHAHTPTT